MFYIGTQANIVCFDLRFIEHYKDYEQKPGITETSNLSDAHLTSETSNMS